MYITNKYIKYYYNFLPFNIFLTGYTGYYVGKFTIDTINPVTKEYQVKNILKFTFIGLMIGTFYPITYPIIFTKILYNYNKNN